MCCSGMSRYWQTAGSVGHHLEQLVGHRRGIGVEQPEPARLGHAHRERAQQASRARRRRAGRARRRSGPARSGSARRRRRPPGSSASASTSSIGRLSCRPRIFGMMQKLQRVVAALGHLQVRRPPGAGAHARGELARAAARAARRGRRRARARRRPRPPRRCAADRRCRRRRRPRAAPSRSSSA